MAIPVKEYYDRLEVLREATKNDVDAHASTIDWLLSNLTIGWTDEDIDPSRNTDAMKELGKSHGGASTPYPPTNATAPSEEEQDVINHYQELVDRALIQKVAHRMKSWADTLYERLRKLKNLKREDANSRHTNYYDAHISDALAATETGFAGDADDSGPENVKQESDKLSGPQKEFREALNSFNEFRKVHKLTRDVKYADNLLNYFALAFICVLFELGINGIFYSQIGDGLIEGWTIAAVVTVAVVGFGWLGGLLHAHLGGLTLEIEGEKEQWKKHSWWHVLKYGGLATIVGVAGVLMVVVAYIYRDVSDYLLNSGALDKVDYYSLVIMPEVGNRLWQWPPLLWPQSNLSPLIILLVNGGILIWVWHKFLWRDDKIPGYKGYATTLKEKREHYSEKIKEIEKGYGLGEEREGEFIGLLEKDTPTRLDIGEMQNVFKTIAGTGRAEYLKNLAQQEAGGYAEECKTILQAYRQASREARPKNDNDGPGYFNEYPEFKPKEFTDITEGYEKLLQKLKDVEDINASEVEKVLSYHRQRAVEIIKESLIKGRRYFLDQHKSEAERQWQEELTKKQKAKKAKEKQRRERHHRQADK